MSTRWLAPLTAIAVLIPAGLGMGVAPAGAESVTPSVATQIALPADAAANPNAGFENVACSSGGNCAAVGVYDGSSTGEPMLVAEVNGVWQRAVVPPPPDNGSPGSVVLNDIACAPGGACTAVGSYDTQSNSLGEAYAISEQNGVWGSGIELQAPADASGDPEAVLYAVSCGAAGSCAAVGAYEAAPNTNAPSPLAVSETDGMWNPGVGINTPSDSRYASLNLVSCAADGSCGAIGEYTPSSGATSVSLQFATSASGGIWSDATALQGPAGAGSTTMALDSLSCSAAGACSAVGDDVTSSPGATPITGNEVVDSETGGTWGIASELAQPAGVSIPEAGLGQVSCTSAGNCSATGGGDTNDGPAVTTFVSETDGSWGTPTVSSAGSLANSLACTQPGACVAVGGYSDASTQNLVAGVFDDTDGTWADPVNAPSPANAAQNNGLLQWVSCTPDGTCTAVGNYEDASGDQLPMATSIGQADSLSASIAVTAPGGAPLTGSNTAVGSTVVATVTVTAPAGNAHSVTALSADPSLTVNPASALSLTGGPSPASIDGTTLAPGTSVSYSDTYTISGTGHPVLSVAVSGSDDGQPVSANATRTVPLNQPLSVTVAYTQNGTPLANGTIRLADADAGEVPQDVTAVVTVTNTSGLQETNVALNGVPGFSYHNPADALQALPVGITASLAPGLPTTFAPGQSAKVSFTVHVTNNGVFDLSPQVLSTDAGSSSTSVSQGLGTLTVQPTALLWMTVAPGSGAQGIRAGTDFRITGAITDRSLTQAIDVVPVEPFDGFLNDDAGGWGGLHNVTEAPEADGVYLPFYGKIEPGQTVNLEGTFATSYIPATRAEVTYDPAGSVVNSDGTETALTASQIGLTTGSSPLLVQVDSSDPLLPPASAESLFDNFTDGAVQGAGQWALGNLHAASQLLHHPITGAEGVVDGIAKMVVDTPRDLTNAAYILGMAEVYADAYVLLTPEQRHAFEAEIITDFDASHLKADNQEVADQVQQGFSDFADAAYDGDYNKLANLAGQGLSTGGGAVADAVLSDVFFQKLSLGLNKSVTAGKAFVRGQLADSMVLADKLRDAKLAQTVFKTVDGIKAGQNLLLNQANALTNAWGLLPEQIAAVQAFCKENKLIVAIRSRSKRAADLIARGLAVGKNEVLKIKGVNNIDVDWLGYRQSDINQLVLAQPLPLSEVLQRLRAKGADAVTRNLVLERYDVRLDEWDSPKVRGVMDDANAQGRIDWGFNGTDNGAPAADKTAWRRFSLYDDKGYTMLDGTTPRTYQEVFVGNQAGPNSRLVRVTQDVDLAAILNANGSILSPELRLKAYKYFSDVLGIEHPETATWIKDGEILFSAKYKELSRIVQGGGEALAVFAPNGSVAAGFFNAALTIYNSATKGGVILFQGGYNNPYAVISNTLTVNLKKFF